MNEEQNAEPAAQTLHVWQGLLDNRYLIRVTRIDPARGLLTITDRGGEKEVEIYRQEVGLAYGAQFGPDVEDVALWQDIAVKVVDQGGKNEAGPEGKDEG